MPSDLGKRIERQLKRRIFGLVAGSADLHERDRNLLARERIERVLVVRANFRLGNLLLMTPALAALRRGLPHARIDVIAHDPSIELLVGSPDVDGLIGLTRRTLRSPELLRVVGDLRRQQYDLAIDGGRGSSFLGAFFTRLSGARNRVATEDCRYPRFFNVYVKHRRASHKADLLLGVLAELGVQAVGRELRVTLSREEHDQAAARCRAMGLAAGMPTVGINLGARGTKQWGTMLLRELVEGLRRTADAAVVLLAGPEDRARLIEAYSTLSKRSVVVAPLLPIREFAALIGQLSVIVTGDTGPMHLAAAVGVPTVSLFVSPHSQYFRPLGLRHRVVHAQGNQLPVREVLAAIEQLLAVTAQRPR